MVLGWAVSDLWTTVGDGDQGRRKVSNVGNVSVSRDGGGSGSEGSDGGELHSESSCDLDREEKKKFKKTRENLLLI